MDEVCSRFADVTDVYTDVYGSILRTESAVLFDSNRVQTDGGIGTVLSLLLSVAAGVGLFLVLSLLRTALKLPLSYVLIFFYATVFIVTAFAPANFIPVSFDAGGVTTGPITVPFIMSLGIGLASVKNGKDAGSDSFGTVALWRCSSR